MKVITRNLRVLRAGRGVTQTETAERAGLSHWRYNRIERGYRTPTDLDLSRLARVLRTTPEEIVSDVVPKSRAVRSA